MCGQMGWLTCLVDPVALDVHCLGLDRERVDAVREVLSVV